MMGSSSTDSISMYMILDEESEVSSADVIEQLDELTKDMDCEVTTDTSASDMTSLMGSGLTINVKGNNLDKLQELAGEVAKVVENTEGTVDVDDGLANTTPSFTISVDKEKAAKYGMTVAQVFQLVYGEMTSSTSATTISTDVNEYQVYVQSEEQSDVTLADIKNLTFTYTDREGNETETALSDIAQFEEGYTLGTINRDAQTRYISVTAGVDDDHNVSLLSNEIQKELDKIDLPEGYSIEMAGEDEMIADAMNQLYLMLLLAVIFIYLVMVAQFQSLLSPFIIMFTIPLAFTGGLFALYFTGNEVSVVAMIGFVMLAGIIVNNGTYGRLYQPASPWRNGEKRRHYRIRKNETPSDPYDRTHHDPVHVHDGSRTWRRFRNDAANGDRNGWRFVIWYTVNSDRCSMYL